MRGDEGVHSSSEQRGGSHTPAGIGIAREQDKKECESRKECGIRDHLGCSKAKQPVLSEPNSG